MRNIFRLGLAEILADVEFDGFRFIKQDIRVLNIQHLLRQLAVLVFLQSVVHRDTNNGNGTQAHQTNLQFGHVQS